MTPDAAVGAADHWPIIPVDAPVLGHEGKPTGTGTDRAIVGMCCGGGLGTGTLIERLG